MAIIADFMLVGLPAPTVSLRRALAIHAGPFAKFFFGCPDNAFQVALAGTSSSFLHRVGAIVVPSCLQLVPVLLWSRVTTMVFLISTALNSIRVFSFVWSDLLFRR
ncbi:protein RETICULATA-RELATED 4, chloroplastic-like [Actinidia eriantha]|uniref:protein RETICULATA-RELATED 4, chloroplastic-like n=1 Tax=Actinidia eriantha TaxID=165200 RepID=UPI0025892072|nr:protein RETICULATA-RELATED 4, chloroplastic-like [Actinidia eriantha]